VQTGTLSALPRPTATPTITPTITPTMAGGAWVLVPGNPTYHPTDFYVMKYEAKQGSGSGDAQQANSIAAGYPWLNIPQYIPSGISAVKACTNIGDGYHLCTAKEAQTINRNIEAQASNWRDGTKISSDCMYGGHMANNPASALAASTDDNPYSGMTAKGTDAFNCPFISSATGKEQRRTFTLSNGTVIWDWSGNVWEWISGDGTDGQIDSTGGVTTWSTASGVEWSTISNERSVLGPSDSSWTASQGMGRYYGGASTNAFYRGGAWSHGASAGCFGLRLDVAPSVTSTDIGFRCCR